MNACCCLEPAYFKFFVFDPFKWNGLYRARRARDCGALRPAFTALFEMEPNGKLLHRKLRFHMEIQFQLEFWAQTNPLTAFPPVLLVL